MKKLVLLFAIVGLLFPPVMSIASNDGGDEIPLHGGNGTSGGNHRSPAQIPLSCYLLESLNSVVLYSSSLSTTADVEITNLSTGDVLFYGDVSISSLPETLPLAGEGEYTVVITLDGGVSYSGDFLVSDICN